MNRREPSERDHDGERDAAEPRAEHRERQAGADRWIVFVPAIVSLIAVVVLILLRVVD